MFRLFFRYGFRCIRSNRFLFRLFFRFGFRCIRSNRFLFRLFFRCGFRCIRSNRFLFLFFFLGSCLGSFGLFLCNLFLDLFHIHAIRQENGHIFQDPIVDSKQTFQFIHESAGPTIIEPHIVPSGFLLDFIGKFPGAPFINQNQYALLVGNHFFQPIQKLISIFVRDIRIYNDKSFVPFHLPSFWL